MRTILAALAVFLAPIALNAQEKREWYRVYTFEESVIDMNTQLVSFSGKTSGRVRFRWNFEKPHDWAAVPGLEYRSRLEVIEFDCKNKRYRYSSIVLLDASGNVLLSEEIDWFVPWTLLTDESFNKRLYEPACRLLELRRNPSKLPQAAEPVGAETPRGAPATAGSITPAEPPVRGKPELKKRPATAPRQ
jgi:hypothetical protein